MISLLFFIHFSFFNIAISADYFKQWDRQHPTILVVFLARNKAHTLPYFLGHLEDLDYPKDRLSLFIRTDHNQDETASILDSWVDHVAVFYHMVNYNKEDAAEGYGNERGPFDWTEERYKNVISVKQEALA